MIIGYLNIGNIHTAVCMYYNITLLVDLFDHAGLTYRIEAFRSHIGIILIFFCDYKDHSVSDSY